MKLRSNEPFWLVKNGLINTYPSLDRDIETDILVVGSGITGALIAHRCIADGYATTLIDRREIANWQFVGHDLNASIRSRYAAA